MIDAHDCIHFDRSVPELEEFWMFCAMTPAANSYTMAIKLDRFLAPAFRWGLSPFEYVAACARTYCLKRRMKNHRIGRYSQITGAWKGGLDLDLQQCTLSEVEEVKGIGPKVARMFIAYSRPNQRLAIIDTHILKFFRDVGWSNVPKHTPPGKHYLVWEQRFVGHAMALGKSVSEFDQEIWKRYSKGYKAFVDNKAIGSSLPNTKEI